MSLKILGGTFKGHKIKAPKGESTRPTKAMLKEAFFNICQQEIDEALFLDLFAGSGAMGIEAISRGAKQSVFIDNHPNAIAVIQKNLEDLQIEEKSLILKKEWEKGINQLHKNGFQFDLIYMDPPYHLPLTDKKKIVNQLFTLTLVRGSLFVEDDSNKLLEDLPPDVRSLREKKYGKSYLMQLVR